MQGYRQTWFSNRVWEPTGTAPDGTTLWGSRELTEADKKRRAALRKKFSNNESE